MPNQSSAKPKRGVGQVIARRRRTMAEAQDRRAAEREMHERARVRDLMFDRRHRSVEDPMYVRRAQQARHALNVLRSDHKAFLAAVGHRDIGVNLGISNLDDDYAKASGQGRAKAYTDFQNIYVTVPLPPVNRPLKEFVIEVRGMLHHEAGHVRFTIPLPELWDCLESLPPEERIDSITVSQAQVPWNLLEDQRMEMAVVKFTPRIANYFVPMVVGLLMDDNRDPRLNAEQNDAIAASNPWLLLAGRSYMPDHIRSSAKREFERVSERIGVTADEWFAIVSQYMGATTKEDMLIAVLAAVRFLNKMKQHIAGPQTPGSNGQDTVRQAVDRSLSNDNEDHKKMVSNVDRSEGDVDMNESSSSPSQPEKGDDGDDGEQDIEQDMQQQAKQAIEKMMESAEIGDIMARVAVAVQSGAISSDDDPSGVTMPSYMVDEARQLAGSIVDALEVFRVEKSPMWMHRQEDGYLDAMAFRTKQPGERTYHRNNVNYDTNGLGLHVSFLADRSGSMSGRMYGLSQTMWAVKTACDRLGVPSTMVLWSNSSSTVRVMEEDASPMVYSAEGGTNPRLALDDVETHVQENNTHHLVFIFTDGAWSGVGSLFEYKNPDRTFVIIGLNCGEHIQGKDADIVIPISSIDDLDKNVKMILTDYVAATL